MRGRLPFVSEDPENYNKRQKKLAKFFDSIIEFFVPDEDEQESNTEDRSCTEQVKNMEQKEPVKPQKPMKSRTTLNTVSRFGIWIHSVKPGKAPSLRTPESRKDVTADRGPDNREERPGTGRQSNASQKNRIRMPEINMAGRLMRKTIRGSLWKKDSSGNRRPS